MRYASEEQPRASIGSAQSHGYDARNIGLLIWELMKDEDHATISPRVMLALTIARTGWYRQCIV